MPIYKVNGEIYDIPASKQHAFEKKYPEATVSYLNGVDEYEIPLAKRDAFLTKFPDATPSSGIQPTTTQTDSADFPMFNDKPNASVTAYSLQQEQPETIRSFGGSAKQTAKVMGADMRTLWGEFTNLFSGSSKDDARALEQLDKMVSEGKDVSEEVEGAWTDLGRDLRTAPLELLPGWMIKGWKDKVHTKAEQMKVLDDIRDVLAETNGDVDKARTLLAQRAKETSYGDEQMLKAEEIYADVKPTEGFAAWVGQNAIQMIPSASALIVGALTKSPAAAKVIGTIGMGAMTASTAGSSMHEAREADASDIQTWKVGVTDGLIEYITEKLPFDRYTSRLSGKAKKEAAEAMQKALADTNSPARGEMAKLLTKANEVLGGKLFSKKNVTAYIADMLAEGVSEFSAEALQTMSSIIYENPEDYPTIEEITLNGWEGFKAGVFMGSILGGASMTISHQQNKARRKEQEVVKVGLIETDNGMEVGEIVGYNPETKLFTVTDGTEFYEVTGDKIKQHYDYTYNEFENARLTELEDEAIENANVSDGQVAASADRVGNARQKLDEAMTEAGYTDEQKGEIFNALDNGVTPATSADENVAKAMDSYLETMQRDKDIQAAKAQKEQNEKESLRKEIEQQVGGRFWREEEEGEAVEMGLLKDGRAVYILSDANENGEATAVTEKGEQIIISMDMLDGVTLRSSLDEFLAGRVQDNKKQNEQTRMASEAAPQLNEIRAKAQPGVQVNLGTADSPILGIILQLKPEGDGVLIQTESGVEAYTYEQLGDVFGTPVRVLTDEQMAAAEAAEIEAAEAARAAELAQTPEDMDDVEATTDNAAKEEEIATETPLPTNPDGSVNEDALFAEDPARWAEWNDSQRNDGGENSRAYIQGKIDRANAKIAELLKAYEAEDSLNKKKAIEKEIAAQQEIVDSLSGVAQKYAPTDEQILKYSEEVKAKLAAEKLQAITERVAKWEKKLGLKVNILKSIDEVKDESALATIAKGRTRAWFDPNTLEVYVYAPHIALLKDEYIDKDVDEAIFHEVVGHRGIKQMLKPEEFDQLLDRVWSEVMTEADRIRYSRYANVKGDQRRAADEYMAHISEGMQYDSIWNKIANWFKDLIGFEVNIETATVEQILRESYRNFAKNGGTVTTTDEQKSAVMPSVIETLSEDLTMDEIRDVTANDLAIAQQVYDDLIANAPSVQQGESSADYIARKRAYNEQLNAAMADLEAKQALVDEVTMLETPEMTSEEILEANGMEVNEDTDDILFSHRYGLDEQMREQVLDSIVKITGRPREEAEKWLESEQSATALVLADKQYLDYIPDDRYKAIKDNSDYPQGTVDFNNICRKRVSFTKMFTRLQRRFPNRIFTADDLADIRTIMSNDGLTVACGLCYVEDRRQMVGEVAAFFIDQMQKDFVDYTYEVSAKDFVAGKMKRKKSQSKDKVNKAAKYKILIGNDTYIPKVYDLTTLEGLDKLYREHRGIWDAFQAFNSDRGQQSQNLFQGYAEYKREILSWSDAKVKKVNSLGGLRVFSYSDFEAHHLLDLIQIIIDCAARGVMIQGYTKVPEFARAVAMTGIKLNRSLIPLGDTGIVDGKLAFDPVEGIDVNDPNFLESNDNVGNILIGINDEQIRLAMADPFIHYIIPYHARQAEGIRMKLKVGNWENYIDTQNERNVTDGKRVKKGINIYTDVLNESITNDREFVEKYLEVCKKKGYIPKFDQFLNRDADGNYTYTPGYYKFLVDFKLFDENGNILPQKPVVAQFDDAFNAEVLQNYVAEERETTGEQMNATYDKIVEALELNEEEAEGEDILFSSENNASVEDIQKTIESNIQKRIGRLRKAESYIKRNLSKTQNEPRFYLNLPKATLNRIRAKMGRDFNSHSIEPGGLKHALKNHGVNGKKNTEKSIPIREEDVLLVPYIMTAPDLVEKGSTKNNRESVRFIKFLSNGYVMVVEKEWNESPDDLETINIWAELSDASNASKTLDSTSETTVIGRSDVAKIRKDAEDAITFEEKLKDPTLNQKNALFSTRSGEDRNKLFETAMQKYGVTNNFNAAGYMLPDGSLLDFSEANDGGDPNRRSLDHRDIEGIIMDEGREYDSRHLYIVDFMNEGAIRMMPESDGINLSVAPSAGQREKLLDYFYKKNGYIILEISNENGGSATYVEYDKGTSPYRIMRDIDGYFNEGIVPQNDILFSTSNNNQAIFVSNAAKAVEGIKQEKATPEQWLKMIEKNGGLKAGEDKWMGLSDWLKASDKKTLTKQEVLDFINEHMIVIEEQHYSNEEMGKASVKILNEKYQGWEDAFSFEWDGYMEEPSADISDYEAAVELYNKHHDEKVALDGDGEFENMDDYEKVRQFGVELSEIYHGSMSEVRPIDGTREQYTTQGLQHLREIALTVPTIESWNESDDIHFGDAGEGRAVAWIRFGETKKLLGTTEVEGKKKFHWAKVLVIDEIQSKRHQEGREKGYKSDFKNSKEAQRLKAEVDRVTARLMELVNDRRENEESELTELARLDIALDNAASIAEYDAILEEQEKIRAHRENREAEELAVRGERRELAYLLDKQIDRDAVSAISAVPDAPFDKNWHELAMKRMLRYAAENGYDAIAWTNGDQQAERYGLSNIVESILAEGDWYDSGSTKQEEKTIRNIVITMKSGGNNYYAFNKDGVLINGEYEGKHLSELVGKELAEKLINAKPYERISGDGLKVGGEGMKGFYDKMLPAFMNKYGKKWGIKVEDIHLNLEGGLDMHSVPVTDEMKESVMEGQLMFSTKSDVNEESAVMFSTVRDPFKVAELESGKKVYAYRSVQIDDNGHIYSPMASRLKSRGRRNEAAQMREWDQSVENLELVTRGEEYGKITILDEDGGQTKVAYNPYGHCCVNSMMNDQFKRAWERDGLYVMKVEAPESELTSGYKAEQAKDAVGIHKWKTGAVGRKLPESKRRQILLTRWMKNVQVMTWEEVAQDWINTLKGEKINVPFNVVPRKILNMLVDGGVKIVAPEKGMENALSAYNEWKKDPKDYVGETALPAHVAALNENKPSDPNGGIRFSTKSATFATMDSRGKSLTPGQQTFFANSKAVDKDGNLLVLYHGTPRAGFTEFESGWFTTSKEDAISYSGDRKGRLFDPNEEYIPETLTAGDFPLGYMTFDSEEDRAAFLAEHPTAESALSESEYENARMQAEDEEYDALTERKPELQEIWDAYREYERDHFVDTTIGDILNNPDAYTEDDLRRAVLAYDSNAVFDSIDELETTEERKSALVDSLNYMNEDAKENGADGILDIMVATRVPRNGEGIKHNDTGNRTYEVYANIERPYEIDADGRHSEFESGDIYKAVESALKDDNYDGIIIRNWRVGRHQQVGDVVVPKNGSQVKLTSNENPTESNDILFSTRQPYESAKAFIQTETDKFYETYNTTLPAKVVYANSRKMIAEALGYKVEEMPDALYKAIREEAKKGYACVVSIDDKPMVILVFPREDVNQTAKVSRILFHENTHPMISDKPELLDLGKWLIENPVGIAEGVAEQVKSQYAEEDWNEEMVCDYIGAMLSLGRSQEALDVVPEEYKPLLNYVYERFGYKPESEDARRRSERLGDARELHMRNSENEGGNEGNSGHLFSTTGTPIEQFLKQGLPLSVEEYTNLAANIFKALPEDIRKQIVDNAAEDNWDLKKATFQIITRLAETKDLSQDEVEMAKMIADKVEDALLASGQQITRPLTTNEALYALYLSTNRISDYDVLGAARKAAVADNLGFSPKAIAEREKLVEEIMFSTVNNANNNATANLYNKGAVNMWTRLKESFVDMFASVEELVKAIEKASGKAAKGFENILLALNHQASKGLAAMKAYEKDFLEPMFNEIVKIMNEAKVTYDDVVRYVILKHGLERNDKMAKRDAREFWTNVYGRVAKMMKEQSHASIVVALSDAKAKVQDIETKLATAKGSAKTRLQEQLDAAKLDVTVVELALRNDENANEQELKDRLDAVEAGTDAKYKELRNTDYSGISSMFYDQLGVDRKNFDTEEAYQTALMRAKAHKYDTLADIEGAAQMEVDLFEKSANTKGLWKSINAATKETLKQQYMANMISKEQYESLRDMFKFYVPLRGFADNTAEDMYTYYRKPNSTGYTKPILGAEGRSTEAESPFGWIAAMASSAIASNVKNEAKLALYYFVSNRPDNGIATISKTWYMQTGVDANGKKIFEPTYPPFSEDLSSDQAKADYEAWQEQMRELRDKGMAYESGQKLNLGDSVVNINDKNRPEHVVNVKIGGKDYTIIINGNPRAAQAINGDLNIEATAQDYSKIFGPMLRWMSSVNTSYNPEFWITNTMRDMLFTWMSVNVSNDPEYKKRFGKNYKKAFKVLSMNRKYEKGTLGNTHLENLYKEFVKNGGVTGYTQIKDNEVWEKEIAKYMKSKKAEDQKIGAALSFIKRALHSMHRIGESLEQVSRFAAFLTAKEMGMSTSESVSKAKDITVNFNRKGSGQRISLEEASRLTNDKGQPLTEIQKWFVWGLSSIAPLGRRAIMFFNASIQGLNAYYKLFKDNPKKMATWAAGYAVIGILNAVMHSLLDDDDDYMDMPDYERRTSLMLGGNGVYFKWALPQEARAFYALGDLAVESIMGRNPHENIIGEALKVALDVAPLNPAEGWRAAVPSVAVPFIELLANEDYKGDPIYNEMKWLSDEEKKHTPNYENAYQGTGKPFILLSKLMNDVSDWGDTDEAGLFNVHPESIEHLVESAFGGTIKTAEKGMNMIWNMFDPEEDVTVRQTPFLNRILTINNERYTNVHTSEVFDYYLGYLESVDSRLKTYKKTKDVESYKELMQSDEVKWLQIYNNKYKKPLSRMKEQIKTARTSAEKKEFMKLQDQLRKDFIEEISNL